MQYKESICECKRCKRHGFDPWAGKIPWSRKWQLIPVFSPGKFHGVWSLVVSTPWGRRVGHDWVTEYARIFTTHWRLALLCVALIQDCLAMFPYLLRGANRNMNIV